MRIDGLPYAHGGMRLMKRSMSRNNYEDLIRDHEEYHGGVYADWEKEADETPRVHEQYQHRI